MKFTTQLALLVVAATATNALTIPDQAVDARSLEVRQNSVPEIVGDLIGVASGGSPEEIATNALILGIEYVMNGFNRLTDAIKKDKINRGEFTKGLVADMSKRNPKFNYVICHTKHETKFDGEKGKDWSHSHKEFDIKIGGTIGYEIYAFKSGTFIRKGDGGYLNWAYQGSIKSTSGDGKTLVFNKP